MIRGFTLVELLVVIMTIVVLTALLIPAMESAVEISRRANCATRIRGMIVIAATYAHDHQALYPTGRRNGWVAEGYPNMTEHVVVVPEGMMDIITTYGGTGLQTSSTGNPYNPMLTCPNFYGGKGHTHNHADGGRNFVIGYVWLGGLPGTTEHNTKPWIQTSYAAHNEGKLLQWESPIRTTDRVDAIMADQTTWLYDTNSSGWMFVAHQAAGPLGSPATDFYNWGKGSSHTTPADHGAVGGNVGRSDGSTAWKPIDHMYVYEGGWPYRGFPAMW
jgi:competence protein ComGC